jgi:hypothetical protein
MDTRSGQTDYAFATEVATMRPSLHGQILLGESAHRENTKEKDRRENLGVDGNNIKMDLTEII